MRKHYPKGIGGRWKTGQRVQETGPHVDQYGALYFFEMGTTFPPTMIGKESVCGHYLAVENLKQSSKAS